MEHLEKEDPKTPDVDLLVVGLAFEDFRGDVFVCPAEGLPTGRFYTSRPAEVANLRVEVFVKQDVLWL